MTETISLTEASHRYRISEKTLRKWIRAAGIATKKPDELNRLQWQIDVAALEKLIAEKHASITTGIDTSVASVSDLELLRSGLDALAERVTALEQQQGKTKISRRAPAEEKSLWDAYH
jgi:hypothetical protein